MYVYVCVHIYVMYVYLDHIYIYILIIYVQLHFIIYFLNLLFAGFDGQCVGETVKPRFCD